MSTRAKVHHLQIAYDKTDSQAREEALALAVDVRARLVAGESFTRLARDYSHFSDVDPVWVYHGDWLDELDQLIWTLPVNEISNVIQTDYGFHLIRVIKREFSDADAYELELHERVLNDSRGGTEP